MVRNGGGAAAIAWVAAACTTTVLQAENPDAGALDLDGGPPAADARAADDRPVYPDLPDDGRADGAVKDAAATGDAKPPVDCSAPAPTPLFTSPTGPYCPFQAGGVFGNCAVGEHCCEYAQGDGNPSTCNAGPTACGVAIATGFDWRCDEANDCPTSQVCCFAGVIGPRLECPGLFTSSPTAHGSACRVGSCVAGEARMCSSSAECPAGLQCREIRVRGKHFGFCN